MITSLNVTVITTLKSENQSSKMSKYSESVKAVNMLRLNWMSKKCKTVKIEMLKKHLFCRGKT